MKTKRLAVAAILVCVLASTTDFTAMLLTGCKPKPTNRERAYAEAERLLLEECTNQTVGLRQVMDYSIVDMSTNYTYPNGDYSHEVTNWHAWATVEFFNASGGVERKKTPFVFKLMKFEWSTNEFLACQPDFDEIAVEQLRQYK